MTLASGADVKIGDYEFVLLDAEGQPGYEYVPQSLYSNEQAIQGLEGAKTANPNVLIWTLDDFAGGAETKYFNDIIPDTYWYGKANPRVRGAVTSPPTREQTTVTLTATSPTEWHTTKIAGKIWAGAGRDVFYSSDSGVTWAQHNTTALFGAGYSINGMTHDGNLPWVTASNGTTRKVVRIDSTTASTTAVSDVTSTARSYGMAMLEGKIYLWTGGALYEYNSQETLPLTHADQAVNATLSNKVHQPHTATPSTFNAGMTGSDNSVLYFTSSNGTTLVYEYKYNAATNVFAGRKIWEPSEGFTAKHIAYAMGVVYLLGDYGDQVALFGMSLINREPLFLSYVGQAYSSEAGGTLTPRALTGTYGSAVMGAVDDGTTTYHFIYDAEIDSLSELDQRAISSDGTTYHMTTVGKKRLAFANTASTTGRVNRWLQDFDTPAGSWGLVSTAHHLNYPYDEKVLFSLQVVQDPSIVAGTVQVEYQIDESGSWVNAGTTSAGVKYTNLPISTSSSTVKFRHIRLRLTGANGARLFNCTVRSYINAYQEVWNLKVLLSDEVPGRGDRPTFRQADSNVLRSYLQDLVDDRNVVAFRDGTISTLQSDTENVGYKLKTVVVEFPSDRTGLSTTRLHNNRFHVADLVLRSTAPN